MSAGKQLRTLRENKNYTRQELSQKAHLSVSTLTKLELDETTPTSFTIFKLANALEIDEIDLIKIFERN